MAYISFQPSDHFNTKLYTSNNGASPRTITGVGFNPDLIWVKNRDSASYNHVIADNVRGTSNILYPDLSNAEASSPVTGTISSTNSDGFVLTAGSTNLSNYDVGTNKQCSWNWKANGSGSSNTDGTITSTVSANTTAGFSIVTYTGTGANATIGHGLGTAPSIVLCKNRSVSGNWIMYHSTLGATKYMVLNATDAQATNAAAWNNTAPTSSVFSVGTGSTVNGSGNNLVAYCFAEKKGFSKFGSYTGNGNDNGPFLYTGFRPAFVIIKSYVGGTGQWLMFDNKRNDFNVVNKFLKADASSAEGTSATANKVDFCSNGVKIRENNGDLNLSTSVQYIYMAFAEAPIVSSNDIPGVAR